MVTEDPDPAVLDWHLALAPRSAWQDSDGRGRHWWRDHTTNVYRDARAAWERNRESGAFMQLELDDYCQLFPPPTFKATLVGLASRRFS